VFDQLASPGERAALLKNIPPDDPTPHHDQVKSIFRAEMAFRREIYQASDHDNGDFEQYYENLYWSAYLLSRIGDPSDVPMMWEAKNLDFDAYSGFDVQFLLGAGSEATLAYLRQNGREDIAEALTEYPELSEDRQEWETWRHGYFYPE
jgi:hypothetical protein